MKLILIIHCLFFCIVTVKAQIYTGEIKVQSSANDKLGVNVEEPTSTLDVDGSLRVRGLNSGFLKADQNGNVSVEEVSGFLKKIYQYGPTDFNVPHSQLSITRNAGSLAGHGSYGTFLIDFQFRGLQENFIFSLEKEHNTNFNYTISRLPGRTTKVEVFIVNNPSSSAQGEFELHFRPDGTAQNDWHNIIVYELANGRSGTPSFIRENKTTEGQLASLNDITSKYENLFAGHDGKVGVGIVDPEYTLHVEGDVKANKIVTEAEQWADFVFEENHSLIPLSVVEEYVKKNKHLPDIPSESEVKEKGIDLASMDAKLLQKIEELTLYLIEQNKTLQAQQESIKQLQKQIEYLEANK